MEALARPMPTRGPPAETEDDYALFLAAMRPTPRERRVAYALIIGLTAAFLVTAAFGDRLLPRLDGFIPTVQAIMCVFYLVTAVLLYGQFAVEPRRSLLAISSGYLLAALAMAVNTLTFPGVYSPTGLLGAGLQTAAWLYYFLYTGFALAIIAYALLKTKDEKAGVLRGSPRIVIAWSILGVVVLVGGWTLFVIAVEDLLPRLLLDPVRVTPTVRFLSSALVVLNFGALILLWSRQRSVLGLWLMVTLVGDLSIIALPIIFYFVRYSLGWYASRLYAVGAAGTLLAVLATETTSLYARLARAMRAQQRDRRDRLMSVEAATAALAHEIRQPLSEITLKSQVALRALKSRPPDLARAQHAGQDAVEACMRASETITGVLRMFRRNTAQSQIVEINDVVREVIDAVSHDARARGVVVLTDLREGLPPLLGDRAQLLRSSRTWSRTPSMRWLR